MRLLTLLLASTLVAFVVTVPVAAVEFAAAENPVRWEDFDDPNFDPTQPKEVAPPTRSAAWAPSRADAIVLGPLGVDAKGTLGRIHTVASGDTLWDISQAYLGTPWVWPSVWNENDEIENPHVISPGDRLWITSTEMRRVSELEAEELLMPAEDETVAADLASMPLEYEEIELDPLPAAYEDVELPLPDAGPMLTGDILTIPRQQDATFATKETMADASSIADAPTIRTYLTQGDVVYLALGEGEIEIGDQFTIFREVEAIRDLSTNAVLGYHLSPLGWLRVRAVDGESSIAVIAGASGEIARGDKIVPREVPPTEVAVRAPEAGLDGQIVYTPGLRWMMGTTDSVYLNLGSIHGIEVGTALEAYDAGTMARGSDGELVKLPDTVIARMVVISVKPETSAAFVTQTKRELLIGDDVRGLTQPRYASSY